METTINHQADLNPENEQNKEIVHKDQRSDSMIIEYETPLPNGHFMSICDKYKNVLLRVHREVNGEGRLEFVAYDHEGKIFFKSEKIELIKEQFRHEKERLMREAHQRRIEKSKYKNRNLRKEPMSISPIRFRRKAKTIEKTQENKSPNQQKNMSKQVEKTAEEKRMEQLQELREEKELSKEKGQELSR